MSTINELSARIEREGCVWVDSLLGRYIMDESAGKDSWTYTFKGGTCRIAREMRQGECHPMYSGPAFKTQEASK